MIPACHNRPPFTGNWLRRDCTAWDIPATPTQFLPQIDGYACEGCRWQPTEAERAERLARWQARAR